MECECIICKNNKPFEMPPEIIEEAIKGNLVLFCGAGISTEGKDVMPFSFYTSVQEELGIDDKTISFSKLMQQYCNQSNGRKKLLQKIRERFQYIHSFPEIENMATFFHKELEPIHTIKTIVTTNWDTYFEDYCGAIPITIPEDFAFWDEQSRFVLKIHGSINNLSSIIATEEDYKRCYKQLQNGIIGATLKNLLCTKTVAFIGFSFGDEDLDQIIKYLRNEMGDLYPHIYLVTLDDGLQSRLDYENCTSIVTSGTFFLHKLKEILIEKGVLKNCSAKPVVEAALYKMYNLHSEYSKIDLEKMPCVAYTLAYQDGVIHAWERFLQSKDGTYNQRGYISGMALKYEEMANDCHKGKDYWNMSYYMGYANGLMYIGASDIGPEAMYGFPVHFLPNSKKHFSTIEEYKAEVEKLSKSRSKYTNYAKKIVANSYGTGMEIHRPPF